MPWENASVDTSTWRRAFTPLRLLMAAGLTFLVMAASTVAYPHLAAAATPPAVLTALRATTGFCLIGVFLLPIAALVRRLIR